MVLFGTNDVICNRNHYERQGQKINFLRYQEIWFISFIYANLGARKARGRLEGWKVGVLEYWSIGVLEYWCDF